MGRMMFVNLPVEDLTKSVDFFTALGFGFDPKFTDENATCMVVGEDSFVMLLVKPFFKTFTGGKELADSHRHSETIMALSAESREEVDRLCDQALENGGRPSQEPMDEGFMYSRSFTDLDGHQWEFVYMDPAALEQS